MYHTYSEYVSSAFSVDCGLGIEHAHVCIEFFLSFFDTDCDSLATQIGSLTLYIDCTVHM